MRWIVPLAAALVVGCTSDNSSNPLSFDFATVEIKGRATSSVDGTPISWVDVALFVDGVSDEVRQDNTDQGGLYEISITCLSKSDLDGGDHYVQARCIHDPDGFGSCDGWQDSEPVYVSSRCPASGESRTERIDFVLDPIPVQ